VNTKAVCPSLGALDVIARRWNTSIKSNRPPEGRYLDAPYKPGKDYEKNEFRVDSWGTVSTRLYPFMTPDIVRCFDGSDFTAADLYFADTPVYVFISFHESDLLSMATLIKFVCESLMMELLNTYDDAPDSMKAKSRNILWSMDEASRIGIPNLPEHASTVVGRKITLSMSAQDRSQFNAIYGHDRTKNLWLFAMFEAVPKFFHKRPLCAFDGCVHSATHMPSVESA
jgi:hypothetical protein